MQLQTCSHRYALNAGWLCREAPKLSDIMTPALSMLAALVAECLACRKGEIVNAGLQVPVQLLA